MFIAEDLLFITVDSKYLIYSGSYHKALIVDSEIFANLHKRNCKYFSQKYLDKDILEKLIKHGMIFKYYTDYVINNYYNSTFKFRSTDISINTVYFHVTQRCNLKCSYCYNKDNLNKADMLKTDTVKSIIDKLVKINVKHINFTGGEILLRKDIEEIVKYTYEKGISIDILTNGLLLSKRKNLYKYVDKFIISLDTLISENNKRIGLEIDKLLSNLNNIPSEYKNKISIRSVVFKDSNDWIDVKNHIEKTLKMQHIKVPFIPNSQEEISYMPDMNCFVNDEDNCILSGATCGASYKILAIDSDGCVYPCQTMINKKFKLANILKENWIEELKNSLFVRRFQNRSVNTILECSTCNIRYMCGGGCSAIAENLYGDMSENSKIFCEFQKKVAYNKLKNVVKKYG
ncbi:radical SAM/SPASM domain-containing protein [Staphylococcus delphini]|uniref:radical SAM/SPASM domain-containing protein n=1 Tax=Staphylococcus delphini TaxID=53344 RepID=UPI0012D2FC8E|nr:radical SAM protein [Staphylococcus delphini]MTV21754.1 radical SAM protein [Staphylococcus delphini]